MRRFHLRGAATLSLLACLVAFAAYAASSTGASKHQRTVAKSKLGGTFSVTVLQGPEAGTSYKGQLKLHGSKKGYLSGTLAVAGSPKAIPVKGQLNGQLIGLSLAIASGKTISGTGVIGYDATTKQNTVGGTASGPSDTSIGVWSLVHGTIRDSSGHLVAGCIQGLPSIDKPGYCYIADGKGNEIIG